MKTDTRPVFEISDIILEVANAYNEVTTSDLQGMAEAAAQKIIALTASKIGIQNKLDVLNTLVRWAETYGIKCEEDSEELIELSRAVDEAFGKYGPRLVHTSFR
jgi:hypothetical protein